ncbi:MAG: DUF2249 domain-containing protein [Myxococcota bacterium]
MTVSIPGPLKAMPTERVVELDARPILAAGQEPFAQIMDAVRRTPGDGALKLHAPFRPGPLFDVLGSQGFSHWVEKGEGAHWVVWFYRDADGPEEPAGSAFEADLAALHEERPDLGERLRRGKDRWVLDVRQMEPPEPMELTLQVLEVLPAGVVLEQVNVRIPQFLLPLLDARGCTYEVIRNDEDEVRLEIVPGAPAD